LYNFNSFIKENIIGIGIFFKTWRIDKALIAFLQCIKQFGEFLENNNISDKVFPYRYIYLSISICLCYIKIIIY